MAPNKPKMCKKMVKKILKKSLESAQMCLNEENHLPDIPTLKFIFKFLEPV
jgi:hypothetical protein